MSVVIREADLEKDREIMIATLRKNRTNLPQDYPFEAKYQWLYLNNPYGKAKAWLAEDKTSSKVIGFTAAIPRKVSVNNTNFICWNCADFSIDKRYRTLGIAIKLREAARICVDNSEVPFLYAHPNERMLVVHKKVGHQIIGNMARYAKPLRFDRKIKNLIHIDMVSKWLTRLANIALSLTLLKEMEYKRSGQFNISRCDKFSKDFDVLFEKAKRNFPICGMRDSEYLNWRYFENPVYKSEVITISDNDYLEGYLVYTNDQGFVEIRDLFCASIEIGKYLLANTILQLRKQWISSISIGLLFSNPYINLLKSLHFKIRPDSNSSMVVYVNKKFEYADMISNGNKWFLTIGDRDL